MFLFFFFFFFQAEDGIRDDLVTGVQTCALPISSRGLTHRESTVSRSSCEPVPGGASATRNRVSNRFGSTTGVIHHDHGRRRSSTIVAFQFSRIDAIPTSPFAR